MLVKREKRQKYRSNVEIRMSDESAELKFEALQDMRFHGDTLVTTDSMQ